MPPIPVHSSSPINTNFPARPFGTSPSTAAAVYTPANTDAGPTISTPPNPTQTARPGAPAVPQPTNTASSTYNSRLEPTATLPLPASTSSHTDSPPPPQPGAVPTPPTQAPKVPIPQPPQPPRPVEIPQWTPSDTSPVRHALPSPTPTHSRTMPFPPTVYTPTRSIPPAGGTSTYPQDLSHPPGYVQDSRASFDDKPVEFCQPLDHRHSPSSSQRGGILDGEPTFQRGENESNVLDTAFAWAKAAGKRLSRTEEQIWKHIHGDYNS